MKLFAHVTAKSMTEERGCSKIVSFPVKYLNHGIISCLLGCNLEYVALTVLGVDC